MTTGVEGARIGLLTASASRLGGGVFEAVVAQHSIILSLGAEPQVFSLLDDQSAADRGRFPGAAVSHAAVLGPGQVGYAPRLVRQLLDADLDCLHLHGIWMYPSAAAGRWAQRTGRPCLISPHGMLDPWITARGRWKKAVARAGYERKAWRTAWRLHALTARESADIAAETGRFDSLIIPNAAPPAAARETRSMPGPQVAYVGRIHPKKNLVALVHGWRAARLPPGSRLVIAGWGDDASVRALREAIGKEGGPVTYVGPVFGAAKADLLAASRFIVLPSLSEGLPMAMLEAWAAATPTLMTNECNLPEGFAAGAALDCGMSAKAIAACLGVALGMDEPGWQQMSQAARGLAASRFSSTSVARSWAEAYGSAISGVRKA